MLELDTAMNQGCKDEYLSLCIQEIYPVVLSGGGGDFASRGRLAVPGCMGRWRGGRGAVSATGI